MSAPHDFAVLNERHPEWSNDQPLHRTARGTKYLAMKNAVLDLGGDGDPEAVATKLRANEELLEQRDLRPGNVHTNTVLQSLSVMYKNDEFIGEELMPVMTTGGKQSGVFYTYNKRDRFAYPDDSMADKTDAPELNQGRGTDTYSLSGRSLAEYLSQEVLNNQDAPLDELVDLQDNVLEGMMFRRELRIASAVQTAANYGSNTVAIAAADRWDTASGGDPGAVVDAAKKALWGGRGQTRLKIAVSLDLHNVLKRHPKILEFFKYSGGVPGFATRQMLAEFFEVDDYLVGSARKDTANEGQTASYSRIWGNSLSLTRVAAQVSTRCLHFGTTFQDLAPQSYLSFEPKKGVRGAWYQKIGFFDQQKIVAADAGYLVTTPIG